MADIASRETADAMLNAVAAYLTENGWNVAVIGSPRIQRQPDDLTLNYEFVLRFTGAQKQAAASDYTGERERKSPFAKHQRVRLSAAGEKIAPRQIGNIATVLGYTRHGTVRIKWDGNRVSVNSYAEKFLRPAMELSK